MAFLVPPALRGPLRRTPGPTGGAGCDLTTALGIGPLNLTRGGGRGLHA